MAGSCECGSELPGSIKCGEFIDKLRTSWLIKRDFAPFYWLAGWLVISSVRRKGFLCLDESIASQLEQ